MRLDAALVSNVRQKNAATFFRKSDQRHAGRFDYSEVVYIDANTPVQIICTEHEPFHAKPKSHLYAQSGNCPRCYQETRGHSWKRTGERQRLSREEFVRRARARHGSAYCCDDVQYVNFASKIVLTCPLHGPFLMAPEKHLAGQGCKRCAHGRLSQRRRLRIWALMARISEVHGLGHYDYDLRGYVNFHSHIRVRCARHGWFEQEIGAHLSGHACAMCCCSRGERRVRQVLNELDFEFCEQARFPECRDRGQLAFDFYIPGLRVLIEYDGKQHFQRSELWGGHHVLALTQRHDAIKDEFAVTHGYRLIRIPYWEFDRIETILREQLAERRPLAA